MAKSKSPAELLKELEQEEKEERKALEAKLKAARERKLAGILKPLLEERAELEIEVKEGQRRLVEIEREIAKLTGDEAKAPKVKGERIRRDKTALRAEAEKIVEMAKAKGGTTAKAIKDAGLKAGQDIVGFVKKHASVTLTPKGETSSRTYHA